MADVKMMYLNAVMYLSDGVNVMMGSNEVFWGRKHCRYTLSTLDFSSPASRIDPKLSNVVHFLSHSNDDIDDCVEISQALFSFKLNAVRGVDRFRFGDDSGASFSLTHLFA